MANIDDLYKKYGITPATGGNVPVTSPAPVTNSTSSQTGNTQTGTSGKVADLYAKYGISRSGTTSLTSEDASKWFDDAYSLFQTIDSYTESNQDRYNADYGHSYSSQLRRILTDSWNVEAYLNAHKTEFENYEEILEALKSYQGALRQYGSYTEDMRGFYSQFESEDQYKHWAENERPALEWQNKYSGMDYAGVRRAMESVEDGKELDWLKEYAPSTMTEADIDREISDWEGKLEFWRKNNSVDGYATANDEQGNLHGIYDDEIADAKVRLEELKARRWDIQNTEKYGAISENADFASMSAPRLDEYGKWGNSTYHYINDENVQKAASAQGMRAGGARSEERKGYDLMTEDEVEMYNYLYHVSGKKAAEEYLDYLSYELAARRTQQISDVNAQIATDSPWLASAMSIPANLMSGIGYVDVAGQNVVKGITEAVTGEYAGPINYNSAAMAPSVMSTSIRRAVAQNLANKHGVIYLNPEKRPILSRIFNGKSWGDVYQLGMSMADSTTTALLAPFIGTAGTVLLGGSAATQGMLDAVANGATDGQALTVGFINGAAEWAFEKIGMDNLVNKIIRGDKAGIVRALISQGLAEGGEELGTSIVNTIADHLIMAEKSGYSRMIEEYKAQGMSPEEAAKRALQDIAIGMGWDFVGGMLSGGIMGGGGHVIGSTIQNAEAKKLYGSKPTELVERVLELDPNNAFAQEMQSKLDSGKKLSGSEIRRLAQQAGGTKGSQESFDTEEAVEDDLTELDETEEDTLEDEYVSEQEMDEGTGPINVDEYSRIVEQAQIEEASEESSVTEQQVEPITVAENATVQEPMAVEENAMSAQESVTEAREAPAAQSLEIEDELDAALAFLDAAPKYESSESTKAVEQTAESREAPAKATTIEEASKKYGAQAGAMLHTYTAGQDVAKYDAAYNMAYGMGKEGVSLDYAKKSAGTSYLSEAQVELAYEAGQAAAGIQPKTESAKPGAVSEKDEFISDTLASFKNVYGNDIVISDEEIRSVLGEAFDRGENMVQAAKAAKKANQAAIDAQVSAKYETQRKANEEARAKKEAEAAKEAETYADDDWGAWDDEPTSTKSEETEVQTETFTGVDVERTEYSPEDAQKTIQSILNSNKEGRGDIKAEEISCIIDNTYLRDAFAAEAGYTLPWERSKAARAIFEASDTDSSKWSEVSAEGFKRSDILADDRTKDGDLMPAMFANAAGMLLVENGLDVPWNIDALSDSEAVEILQSRKPGKGAYAQELARMTANIRARSVSLSGNQNSRLVDQKFAGDKVSTPQMAVLAYVPRILDGDGNARMSTAEWIKQAFNTGNEGDYAEGIDSLIYDYAQALRVKELIRGGTRLGQLEGKVPQKILDLYRAIEERGLYAKVTPHGSVQGGINEPGRIKVDRKPVAQSKQAPRTANETKAPAAPKATAAKPAASTKVTQTATKAVITAKNEEVSIKRIASVENGEMTLELADGRIISANDVSITADGEALIYETVASMGVDAEAANKLVSGYDSSITAEAYAAGIQEAFEYGRYDTFERMEADKRLAKTLTAEQRRTAFEIGQKAKETKVKSDEAAIKGAYEKAKAVIGDGKKARLGELVYEDGIKERSLTKAQKTVADEGRIISAALGVNVHIYSGMAEYGYCSKETGDIWLNVNANISGQTLMQTTMSHELVHTVRERAPAKFQAFADFLVSEYSKKGVSIKKLMIAKQQEYAEDGIELTADDAYEEVIAEAASTMLTDSNAVKRLAELNKDHPDIVTMIREFFQDLLSRIQSLFGQMPADSYEAQLVRQMEQETQKILQNLYADMLIDAGKYNTTIKQAFGKNTTIETNAEGEFLLAKNNGGSESPAKYMYNAATWESGGRDTLAAALKREGFSAKDIKAALTIMDAKYELVKQLGQEYTEQERINQIEVSTDIKDGHSVVSALVTNGDYPVNIDLLMVCKKRQAYQKVINRLCETGMIQKATVDSLAIAEINKILGKYGFETACLGCFVESRRLRVQEWAETICKEWNAEVKKRNPNADAFGFGNGEVSLTQEEVMQLVAELESGGEKNDQGNLNLGRGSAVKRMGVLLDKVPSLQKTLTVEDLLTPQGLTALRQYDSNLFSMVKSRYGSNSPKYVQDFNPYNSELAKYGKVPSEYKDLREYLYAIGGARMQSFSDFIVENWFDYCQIVADLAARKLPMHTYTKEIALVKLFGMTGIKVNMSLIPDIDRSLGKEYAGLTLNENGEYELIWADKDRYKATGGKTYMQSINFADAIALQEDPRYSSNVGTIAVGISDKHIEMMLDDSRIRMIIPYHSSGMNPIYADMVGSSFYKDYTATQNTTVAYLLDSKGNRKSLTLTKEQAKKLTAGFEFNQTLQELGDARATAEAYKAWCRDASKHTITIKGETYTAVLTPKFSQFAYHDNYYKLLEDFNCYDCITEQAAPQGDVTQTYPEAFEDILREEVQAREDYRQKQDPKFNDAMAEIESFLEHHSKADSVYYAEQRGIKLGAKDKKLSAAEKAKLAELKAKDTGKGKTMYRMPPKADPAFSSKTAKAVEVFGTTTDFNEAGFILPSGEMLRFTDDKHKGERQYDHRAIGMAYGVDVDLGVNRGYNKESNKHLDDFVENGGIRFDPGSLEFNFDAMMQMSKNVPPTREQEQAIRDFIEWKKQREEQYNPDDDPLSLYRGPLALRIDFGETSDVAVSADRGALGITSLTYEGGQINANRIIADIRHYYQTGETRQPSSLAQFRYRMPTKKNMRDLNIERKFIKYGDIESEKAAIDETVESLIAKGKTVTITAEETDMHRNATEWDSKKEARKHLKEILKGFLGDSVFFNYKGVKAEAYLTKEGLNHSSVGINTPERAGAFSKYKQLIVNAEYSYSSKNDVHSNANKRIGGKIDWDCFVAVAMLDGEPYPVVFKIRTTDRDVRSQIYKMATKNEIGSIHDLGQQESSLGDVPNYDGTPISGDSIPQSEADFKNRISGEANLNTRQLLANAFESVAQNDIEREKIREYKKKIDLVNAEEQKLQRLRAEIKKLSFAKGPRDAKRISKLQDEATKTANRISVYDQQLLRLEASKPLQAVVEREKTKAKKLAEKKGREALAAYREKAAQTQQKMLERYRESRSNAKIGRDKTAMRHKIKDIVDELNNYLLKGTKDKHVMIGLQKAVASALDVVNMDTVGAEERLKALSEKMAKETDPIKLNDLLASYRRIMEQGEKMSEKLQNLRAAYAEIKDSSDPLIANSHDEVIEAAIEAVAKNVGETPLRDMTLEQLQDVYDLYKMVLTAIRTSNKSFKADKKKSIDSLASSVQAEVEEVGGKKKFGLKNFGAVNSFLWNNFKPVYAFKAIGSKTLSRLFNNVRAGEDVWAKDVSAAKAFYLEQSKKHGYDSWDLEKTHTFTSTTGMDFKLTLEQIMSLYAYSKRKQAEDHLKFGGIVFEDSFETKKLFGKFDIKLKTEDATAYNISPETLAAITATLTADQKAFVDAMQDYLSTTMGEKGNEVSLEMYGVKLFKEKFYFPLKSATQYMAKAREQAQGDVKIKNKGFTKDTNPKAKNPIVLESFMDVWASHVNEMSMYHAFTLPLEDFYRVYNYKTPSVNENMPTEGVNPAIQNAYGKAATKYIEQLLRDLNGGARSDPTAGFINKMMGLFKKGAVFASASVVIQQPSAIARAMALVDSKYFIGKKLDDHKHKALWEEVKQYAPVAMIKEMGYFDTNMGMSTVDFIKAKEYESWDEKMKALVTDGDYRDEVLSKAPALADEIAWCMIWEAVKRETIDKHPALKATSEEFLQLAGARFTEVIVNTQVYDSVLSRSANMRSKDTGMKMATAFLAEPTTNINMIADALVQGKRGDKKQARKAIGAVMASQILNAILVSFVYAGRDDDDEKTYWEKYFASVLAEVKDSFNLASYIPFLKDIVSIVQGYDVERSDIAVIADIWKAYEQLDSDSLSGWRKVENFVGGIASLFGLPVKNIMRDARALYQTVDLAINGEKTTAAGMKYAIKEALTGEEVKNADQLLEALIDGDEAHAERVMGRFEDESKANTALRSSIKSGFTGGRFDADAAVEMLVDYTDMDEDDAYWKVQEWLAGGEEFSRYGRVFDAVRNGGNFNSAMDELVAHGYDEKEVLSKVKGQIGTWYKEGEITRQQATQMLGRYMDMESEDITKTVDKWEFARDYGYAWEDRSEAYSAGEISREELITSMMEVHDIDRQDAEYEVAYLEFQMNYPEFDLAKSTYLAYHRDIDKIGMSLAEAGIDIGVYAMYSENKKGVSGKVNILPIIDALPITPAQKDAIYYKEGWASSTIWDTPWHR